MPTVNKHEEINMLSTLCDMQRISAQAKGAGAERLESLATILAALDIPSSNLRSIEIDWIVDNSDGDKELLPTFKATFWEKETQ